MNNLRCILKEAFVIGILLLALAILLGSSCEYALAQTYQLHEEDPQAHKVRAFADSAIAVTSRVISDSTFARLQSDSMFVSFFRVTSTMISSTSDIQTLAAANTINPNAPKVFINGSGAAVTLISTPTMASGTEDGEFIIVQGSSYAVTIQDESTLSGSGIQLRDNNNMTLGEFETALFSYDSLGGYWVEINAGNLDATSVIDFADSAIAATSQVMKDSTFSHIQADSVRATTIISNTISADQINTSETNTHTISPVGGEYATTQAALDANPTGGALFLVYPGTYTDDTINFTANDQHVVGMSASPIQVTVTSVDARIANFGAYTGCIIRDIKMAVTAATTAINTVEGSGSFILYRCHVGMTTSAAVVAATQAACVSATATVKIKRGTIDYNHTGNGGGGAIKAAVVAGTGAVITISDGVNIDVDNSGTALISVSDYSAGTGVVTITGCDIDVNDSGATITAGVGYVGAAAAEEYYSNIVHVANNNNAAYGLYHGGNGTIRSMDNHYHVTSSGGSAYSFYIGGSATLASQADVIIAANGYVNNGTFTMASFPIDGSITGTGDAYFYNVHASNDANIGGNANITGNVTGTWTGSTIPVEKGGTETTSLTDGGIMVGGGTGAVEVISVLGNGELLIGGGTNPNPSTITGTANEIDVTNTPGHITMGLVNPLIVGVGGMGAATFTEYGVLFGAGTGPIEVSSVLGNGELLIGGGTNPNASTLTGTADEIEITNTAGHIQIGLPDDVTITGTADATTWDINLTEVQDVYTSGVADGTILIYDGTDSQWEVSTPVYGDMYMVDNTVMVTIGTKDEWTLIDGSWTEGETNEVTFSDDHLIAPVGGMYLAVVHLAAYCATQNQEVEIAIAQGTHAAPVVIEGSRILRRFTVNDIGAISTSSYVQLEASEEIHIVLRNRTSTANMGVRALRARLELIHR